MNKKIIAISVLIEVIFFVSALAGMIFYYNDVLTVRNSKIASLNNEIANINNEEANLNSQISNLTGQVANLTGQVTILKTANLVTSLGMAEYQSNPAQNAPYNLFCIRGSVTNTGGGTAYNAGLHVVAFVNGELEINMIVPLTSFGIFGTDSGTNAYIDKYFGSSSTQLGLLNSEQNAAIDISIYHEGNATNWTVTPVWTNSP